jgi:hypothetical protein
MIEMCSDISNSFNLVSSLLKQYNMKHLSQLIWIVFIVLYERSSQIIFHNIIIKVLNTIDKK